MDKDSGCYFLILFTYLAVIFASIQTNIWNSTKKIERAMVAKPYVCGVDATSSFWKTEDLVILMNQEQYDLVCTTH